jgi:hypothetical protein
MGIILKINGRTCVGHEPVDAFIFTGRIGKIANDSAAARSARSARASAYATHTAHTANIDGSALSSASIFNAAGSARAPADAAHTAFPAFGDTTRSTHSPGGIDVSAHAAGRSATAGPARGTGTIRIGRFRIGTRTEPVKILGTVEQGPGSRNHGTDQGCTANLMMKIFTEIGARSGCT